MHTSVLEWLQQVRADMPDLFVGRRVLECGSYDINGSARVLFQDCDYTGLDWRHGPGVDVVGLVHEYMPDDGNLYDVVVSTEMLEHDPYWSASVRRMCELLRPGGALLLTWAAPNRVAHEVHTAPVGGYYCGLHPLVVQDVAAPYFGNVQAELSRGGLDGWLLATDRLPFARNGKGILSVVIGTVGKPALVRCCIAELRRTATMPLEIVVVDNGSTAHESALIANLRDEHGYFNQLLHYPQPIGYAAAYNAGIQASTGEYVLLLNNDAWPMQRGWDARLVEALEGVPDAMLVTPTMPRVTYSYQRAIGPKPPDCTVLSVPLVAFVAPLLRRTTLDETGPLDEAFVVGGYEDADYCERIRQAGGKILVDPAVWFFHISGATMMPLYEDVLPVNERTFMNKWKGKAIYNGAETIDAQDSE